MEKSIFGAGLSNFCGRVPCCTLYYHVGRLAPVAHIQGSAFTGSVGFGRVSAVDARGSVERGFDNVASNRFHGFLGCLPPSILRVGAGNRQSRFSALGKSERKVRGCGKGEVYFMYWVGRAPMALVK